MIRCRLWITAGEGRLQSGWSKRHAERQIIVFTHDLDFVNDLHDMAEEKKLAKYRPLWSARAGGCWDRQRRVALERKASRTGSTSWRNPARAAKKLYDDNKEDEYNAEAAGIYNLRASWERGLEEIAFSRVVQRHRHYIDTKQLKKVSVLTEADCDVFHAGFKKCCDIVDAHDPSSGKNAAAPPPAEVLQDIEALQKLGEGSARQTKAIRIGWESYRKQVSFSDLARITARIRRTLWVIL